MSLLRRVWPLVPVSAIGLCAFFGAQTLSHALEVELLPEDKLYSAPPVRESMKPPAPRVIRSKDGTMLVSRSMFCSSCEWSDGPDTSGPTTRPTALPLRLLATQIAEPSSYSFATLVNTESGRQGAYQVGELVPGGVIVHAVHKDRVELRLGVDGPIEVLDFGSAPIARSVKASASSPSTNELAQEYVRVVSATRLEVDRRLIERLRGNPLLADARFRPQARDGKMRGIRFYAVKRTGLAHSLGLRNGDVLVAANGVALSSAEAGLELLGRLGNQDHWSLGIERGRERIELEIELK